MNTEKITEGEICDMKISSLPSRPTAPKSFGGKGYTASDMKAAFDMLPLFIIARFNSLIDDIHDTGDGSLAAAVPTGLKEGHTLSKLFTDITSGELASYLTVADTTLIGLYEEVSALREAVDEMRRGMRDTYSD